MKLHSKKLRDSARGKQCTVRIPGVCNFNPETTVLAHFRMAGTCGMGIKPSDLQAARACSACHDVCDGRAKTHYSKDEVRIMFLEGVLRTLNQEASEGLITVKGAA